ncbi:biliverdin-producing heme oxygenase [Sphingomonas naphthae]|uniref:Biliverdin-producing heme oxygenase n=1 Tax=Sphingomonas naphthae TaxID=1813468 RepID=A0ABY7TNR7_9SPHN|nr:biliverdin-producing heme oxygenase [Sphingomonas naphthae]WCT74631.1 biliverdin-producing heme oxygenase [Sphingomonas naphthae]
MSFPVRQRLRAATHATHEALDAAFAGYDLGDGESYAAFLTAHARALLPIEDALGETAPWPRWSPRGPLLRADLAALGRAVPAPISIARLNGEAARWGTLYVIEGSRLGGAMLAERVADGLPRAYLAHKFAPGEWRDFMAALDDAATGEDWVDEAIMAAEAAFATFARAARVEDPA